MGLGGWLAEGASPLGTQRKAKDMTNPHDKITVGSSAYKTSLTRWLALNAKRITTPLDVREQHEFNLLDAALERAEMQHSVAQAGAVR